MKAIAKTGFFIPAAYAPKLGELQATTDLAADLLKATSPHLAGVLSEWYLIIRNLEANTYYEPVPVAEEIEVVG